MMAEFEAQLRQQPDKAAALRQAQVTMLWGEVRMPDGV
ncbi:hypothetical protein [Halomicronema sp. CCY15110]